ncbi:hypothetical protein [Streptomyces sp. NA04227]|nr:hypothetical protein [Streptomyces sp. NA04227]
MPTRDPARAEDRHATVYDPDRGGYYPPEKRPTQKHSDPPK